MADDREALGVGMTSEVALAIINTAKAGGYEDEPVPQDEEELIARAVYWWREARKAFFEANMRDNAIQTIIWEGDAVMPKEEFDSYGSLPKDDNNDIADSYPRRSSGGLSESDERETEGFNPDYSASTPNEIPLRERLPIPPHIEGDPDPMPRDLVSLGDKEIRRLSGEYNAYLARVTYLLGVESSDLANAEHLLDAEKARAIREIDTKDPNDPKKSKLAKVIEAEIAADPKVKEFSDAVAGHQQSAIVLKSLKEIYSGNIDRLSREWTMRQNEWEKSR